MRIVRGEDGAVEDELPTVPGLQISLDAAEARLFLALRGSREQL